MSNSLVIRDTWFTRFLRAAGLVTPTEEDDFKAGADYASDYPAVRSYPASTSMSAYAAFPWVYACADAIASDLSMLPIKAVRGKGAGAEVLESHPVIDLLSSPSSRVDGILFRRQLVIDLVLTGDAYAVIIGEREPTGLLRMHPARTKIVPLEDGQPARYEYSGSGYDTSYDWSQVVHVRSPSWEDSPASLYGQGAIRALNEDLQTDLSAAKLAANSAKTGRPSAIITPSEEGDRWSAEQIAQIRAAYQKQLSGTSGALFMGGPAKYTSLGFSPRDMEYQAVREYARESTLAAFSVPPTRVGLPTANYATARQQAKTFWESLRGRAKAIDAELTRLARKFPGSEDVTVMHDFSSVEALQESSTERVNRVQMWWLMGVPLAEAAAYEGFEDLPVGMNASSTTAPQNESRAPVLERRSTADAIGVFFRDSQPSPLAPLPFDFSIAKNIKENHPSIWGLGEFSEIADALFEMVERDGGLIARSKAEEALIQSRDLLFAKIQKQTGLSGVVSQFQLLEIGSLGLDYMSGMIELAIEKSDAARVAVNGDIHSQPIEVSAKESNGIYWKIWIDKLHTPIERAFTLAVRRYASGAAERTAQRFADLFDERRSVVRALSDVQIDKILAQAEEAAIFDDEIRAIYEEAVRRGYAEAAARVGIETAAPVIESAIVRQSMETLIGLYGETTGKLVIDAVERGIAEGLSVNQIQQAIETNAAFDPVRSLRVSRTETTRALNAAANAAFDQASLNGVPLRRQWVSARDNFVRSTHEILDGTIVNPGESFVSSGESAAFPGGFGVASEDINCRCGIREIFE